MSGVTAARRVLFASFHSYLPDRSGGLESSTHELVLALKTANVFAAVLCRTPDISAIDQCSVNLSEISHDDNLGYDVFRAPDPSKILPSLVAKHSIDVIVIHSDRSLLLVNAAETTSARIIIYVRDVEFGPWTWRLKHLRKTQFIANSAFVARRTSALLGIKIDIVYPLVRREYYYVRSSRERVLFVNPTPKKGAELAIFLARERPDVGFDFVESWPLDKELRDHYETRTRPLGNVVWHSRHSDMRVFYAQARVTLLPSIWEEGWGRIVTEGQISGIPSLASDRGGLPEAVGSGGALVSDYWLPSAWRNTFDQIWDDKDYYNQLAENAVEYSQRFDIDECVILNRFLKLLNED
jgi:glycosyltransferase involved in cell wall biosynthesis